MSFLWDKCLYETNVCSYKTNHQGNKAIKTGKPQRNCSWLFTPFVIIYLLLLFVSAWTWLTWKCPGKVQLYVSVPCLLPEPRQAWSWVRLREKWSQQNLIVGPLCHISYLEWLYKIPQNEWLKAKKYILSQFWRLEGQYQGASRWLLSLVCK